MCKLGNILVVIPARGGSKRLPRKNVMLLAGRPLISWTIEAALESRLDACIMVTSDDDEILELSSEYKHQGVITHKRPHALATDIASTNDVLSDALMAAELHGKKPQTIMLLQPTSPLRKAIDIGNALDVYCEGGCRETVVSVCEVDHPTAWVGTLGEHSRFEGCDITAKRSQDYQKEYCLNGAIYIVDAENFLSRGTIFTERLLASVMPKNRSVDIDDQFDFQMCENLVGSMHN